MNNIIICLIKILLNILSKVYSFIFHSKKGIIIINSIRYNDNSRYLFEYIAKKKRPYRIVWITNNSEIKNFLKKEKLKCGFSFFEQLHYISLAKIAIFSGSQFEDRFNFLNKKTIKYCLNHGVGPKIALRGAKFTDSLKYLKKINDVDYSNFTSKFAEHTIGRLAYKLPSKKIINLGYPRNDQLFKPNANDVNKCFSKVYENLKLNFIPKKIILYSPTWREVRKNYSPLKKIKKFRYNKFNEFLIKKKFLLLCTKHPNSQEHHDINFSNIKLITNYVFPSFDINMLLPKIDILITDYSTISTDFAILKKPQLFLLDDFDEYFLEESLIEDFRNILPGKEIKNYNMLIKELSRTQQKLSNDVFLNKYYDTSNKNSREKHFKFLNKLMK